MMSIKRQGVSGFLDIEEEEEEVVLRTWVYNPVSNVLVEKEETEEDLWKRRLINPGSPNKLKWDLFIGMFIIVSVGEERQGAARSEATKR